MKVIFCVLLIAVVKAGSFIEMIGMGDLLQGLAVKSWGQDPFGQYTTAYMLDPTINAFLLQFNTRTDFCDYKCTNIFNLPCFILFGCNIQIRNFVLMFLFPFVMLTLGGLCCGKGLWTFNCWLRYLAIFTGISFVIWAMKKISLGGSTRKRKKE